MPETSPRIVLAGGSGFLGTNLARHLTALGWQVVVLGRHGPTEHGDWLHLLWDARTVGDWAAQLDGASALVNLAGRSVDCIKTPEHCDEILRSRVEATRALGQALGQVNDPPAVWVQMATAHRYGDPPEVICDEDSAFGFGLAPAVGEAWEQEHARWLPRGMRSVVLRTSFVLGRRGGALRRLERLVRWGLGGTIGHGRQGMSWLHEHDMNRLFERAIGDGTMSGAYIATSPNPVSNAEFMRTLRRMLRRPIGLPAPASLVRLGAPLIMRTDPELALYGRYCMPRRLLEMGFDFTFPDLPAALADLCGKPADVPEPPPPATKGGGR